eukprot:1560622-Prymnesium_polylepis.1
MPAQQRVNCSPPSACEPRWPDLPRAGAPYRLSHDSTMQPLIDTMAAAPRQPTSRPPPPCPPPPLFPLPRYNRQRAILHKSTVSSLYVLPAATLMSSPLFTNLTVPSITTPAANSTLPSTVSFVQLMSEGMPPLVRVASWSTNL